MTSIDDVIGWKFNHMSGMFCREIDGVMAIVEFPPDVPGVTYVNNLPSSEDQAAWTAEYETWLAQQESAEQAEATRLQSIKDSPDCVDILTRLASATPTQIDNWVENNVTNIETAQEAFKKVLKVLALLARNIT